MAFRGFGPRRVALLVLGLLVLAAVLLPFSGLLDPSLSYLSTPAPLTTPSLKVASHAVQMLGQWFSPAHRNCSALNHLAYRILLGSSRDLPQTAMRKLDKLAVRISSLGAWIQHEAAHPQRTATDAAPAGADGAKNVLKSVLGFKGVVLQPLGGPDILWATQFFPKASTIFVAGVEPIGAWKDYQHWEDAEVLSRAKIIEQALAEFADNAIIPPNIQRQAPLFDKLTGVFPLLITSLFLAGKQIFGVRDEPEINGIQISFRDESGTLRRLYYSQQQQPWSNPIDFRHFKDPKYLGTGKLALHLRVSQYDLFVPHNKPFLDFLRTHASLVVQDDSGWPFEDMITHFNQIQILGNYVGPAKLLRQHVEAASRMYQTRLLAVMTQIPKYSLPSPVSYQHHWHAGEAMREVDSANSMDGQILLLGERLEAEPV